MCPEVEKIANPYSTVMFSIWLCESSLLAQRYILSTQLITDNSNSLGRLCRLCRLRGNTNSSNYVTHFSFATISTTFGKRQHWPSLVDRALRWYRTATFSHSIQINDGPGHLYQQKLFLPIIYHSYTAIMQWPGKVFSTCGPSICFVRSTYTFLHKEKLKKHSCNLN